MTAEKVENFCQITGSNAENAISYLAACNDNLEMAVSLYMDSQNHSQPQEARCRSPIPHRTEQLVPIDLPLLSSQRSMSLRSRRRAFVENDSDNSDSSEELLNGGDFRPDARRLTRVTTQNINGHSAQQSSSTRSTRNTMRTGRGQKRDHLSQLYSPPAELLYSGTYASAVAAAAEKKQWLLVSLHDDGCFDCHILNRDVWKDCKVYQLIKRNFLFIQLLHESSDGILYRRQYPYVENSSHMAIINPLTGEQKMMWLHLKDADRVHGYLLYFITYNKLVPDDLEVPTSQLVPSSSDCRIINGPQTSGCSPFKRPRLNDTPYPANLCSRVADVSLLDRCTTVSSTRAMDTANSSSKRFNPLDMSEEEQLKMAIQASTLESTDLPSNKPSTHAPSHNQHSSRNKADFNDEEDDLIVLTDDDEIGGDTMECEHNAEGRLIYKTNSVCTETFSADSGKLQIHTTAEQHPIEASITPMLLVILPEPGPNDDAIELAVRLPDGTREILRLPSSLTIMLLQSYFTSRGFPPNRYEMIRLYPRICLSSLPGTESLLGAGLAKKDTIFVQEI